MSDTIVVQLDAVQAMAEELATLGAELADEIGTCRSVTASLLAAVDGDTGRFCGQAGTGWAALTDLLAQGSGAVAAALRDAVHSYRSTDAVLAHSVLLAQAGLPLPR